ncbi:hypothetical protein HZY83_02705 [Gemella sp. GH3]|uniref:CdaR family protein n=1 Tax=unclassified Gemella TaxID=2624949 RepID=UPI0015D0CFD0|nr:MULTISPECIES: CdaR family protein [unclassified Gemella]MBF0713591.1 hypothetical protein [Gemella sp. GH3.1]NYS50543.1 hypothetical protein [Gemella sp. GH3]
MKENKNSLKIISLLIAILLFISVNDNLSEIFSNQAKSNHTTTWIRNVPVEVNYDKEKFYVLGIPDTVDVKITGPVAKVQKESLDRKFKVKLDFSKINVGDDQKIKVEITDLDSSLEAVSEPEFVTASVRNRITKEFSIVPVIKNERLLLGYSVSAKTVSNPTVKISGAEESINSIYEVRAESDVKTKINSNVNEEAKLVAYDRNFNKIEDIDMERTTTTINITVESIEKTLPVSVNQIGTLPAGYSLESIDIVPENVNIRTETKESLATINEVFVDVELSNLTSSAELSNLKVYANTSIPYSLDTATVKVNIKIKKN